MSRTPSWGEIRRRFRQAARFPTPAPTPPRLASVPVPAAATTLNDEQRAAVGAPVGPTEVVAGPGTGKTATISWRWVALEQAGAPPERMVAVTFTARAARQMQERIGSLGGTVPPGRIGTFHSLALRSLRSTAPHLTVVPEEDRKRRLKQWLESRPHRSEDLTPGLVGTAAELAGAWGLDPGTLTEIAGDLPEDFDTELVRTAADWMAHWDRGLVDQRAVDFQKMISAAADAAEQGRLERTCPFGDPVVVLVDEYQDTNLPQERLLVAVERAGAALFVVGDPNQAIYGWRGASADAMARFVDSRPGTTVITLGRNYRSSVQILSCAAMLVGPGPAGGLVSQMGHAEPVRIRVRESESAELAELARWVRSRPPGDSVAVVARTNRTVEMVAEGLAARGIPVEGVTVRRAGDHPAGRLTVAWLAVLAGDRSPATWQSAVCSLPGVGPARAEHPAGRLTVAWLAVLAGDRSPATWQSAVCSLPGVGPARAETLAGMLADAGWPRQPPDPTDPRWPGWAAAAVEALAVFAPVCAPPVPPQDRVVEVFDRLVAPTLAASTDPAELALVREALAEAVDGADPRTSPVELVDTLVCGLGAAGDDRGPVTVLTVHDSKGREYDHVWVFEVSEGQFPHALAVRDGELDEERRLLFVAVTRARRSLVLSWSTHRDLGGRTVPRYASRFLEDLLVAPLPAGQRNRHRLPRARRRG